MFKLPLVTIEAFMWKLQYFFYCSNSDSHF